MKPLILLTLTLSVLFGTVAPMPALAQETPSYDSFYEGGGPTIVDGTVTSGGFVPCSGTDCSLCDFAVMANTIIKWLIGILFMFFAVLAVIAGFKLVTSGGNPGAKQAAKSSFTNAFIGLFIVFGAWILIDTLLRALLAGGTGEISGFGPWSEIECASQVVAGISRLDIQDAELKSNNYYIPDYVSSGAGGGSCSVITDSNNPCNPTNLAKYFGSRAEEASMICNKESGGQAVNSRTDICCGTNGCQSGDPSFSGGIFQINVLANAQYIPGCSPNSFFTKNGTKTAQGDCVQRNSKGICTGWSCQITDASMYNTCMRATKDATLNLQVASKLFNNAGGRFTPWDWSRKLCKIQ